MNTTQKEAHMRMLQSLPVRFHARKEPPKRDRNPKVQDWMIKEWKKLRKKGMALKDIASRYEVSASTVGSHCRA